MKAIALALLLIVSECCAQETWQMIPMQEQSVYQTLVRIEDVVDSVQLGVTMPARSAISRVFVIVDSAIADVDSLKLGIRGHGVSPGNLIAYSPDIESGDGAMLNYDGMLYGSSMSSGQWYTSGAAMQRIGLHIKQAPGGTSVGQLRIIIVIHQH